MKLFMTEKDLPKIAPLIKDRIVWNAFLALLDHEEAKCVAKLVGICTTDELLRINAEYKLIQHLRKARDNWLRIEEGLKNGS